jgi:transposase
MKTASVETRALVVKAYTSGTATRKQLSKIFGYHIQSIGNWIREFEREGRLAPHAKGHRKAIFTDEEKTALTELLRRDVDVTLKEIRELFGKTCSLAAIQKTVVKLGFVFKKNTAGKRVGSRRHNSEPE